MLQKVKLTHRKEGEGIGGSAKSKAHVTDISGVRALRAELFQSLLREMPLPEAAGQGRQKGTCTPTSVAQFAYVIPGRGVSVTKHRAVHCGV